jgi:hypothetical protein
MLWSIGFLVTFLFGGLTGVILASPPMDFHVTDSYFVVAQFHYVLFGTIVFATFAGFSFWWPRITGTMLDERLGKIHFWTLFVGFHTTFLVQHCREGAAGPALSVVSSGVLGRRFGPARTLTGAGVRCPWAPPGGVEPHRRSLSCVLVMQANGATGSARADQSAALLSPRPAGTASRLG